MEQVRSLRPDAERQFIDTLRRRFEEEGFAFTAEPDPKQLPSFLGSYVPDALAQKAGSNIVIEVKQQPSLTSQRALSDIKRRFDGQPDWQFRVFYRGSDPHSADTIAPVAPDVVRRAVEDVRRLTTQGDRRAAFIMGWSLLEAALRARRDGAESQARMPGTVVQTLAMDGMIEPETERRLRHLVPLRNRLVHGDLAFEPTAGDVETILTTVDEVLNADLS
ncbi:hypothetical protein [Methylobacterium sp. B4]|uniref:hypothetical protein n=1 Tax=Methylobacterium sp. B4 TaxID=1938755 RepID=UPI000D76C127|nr:hypothetical protein [Methylobacterium sp. B4]PXW65260.1 uncharacterized protein YutE (UPF0331/DUF86 family) [Methylobacterium sp. B4]